MFIVIFSRAGSRGSERVTTSRTSERNGSLRIPCECRPHKIGMLLAKYTHANKHLAKRVCVYEREGRNEVLLLIARRLPRNSSWPLLSALSS